LKSKEPRKRDRRPIGFIVPDEKKEWNAHQSLTFHDCKINCPAVIGVIVIGVIAVWL
jgi:hypothetical protein